ncbi:hypothetical protein PGB90_007787 [Kerria lacca]
MRVTAILNKYYPRRRYTDNESEVIFKTELPIGLRNFVSGKGRIAHPPKCIQEMYTMMACLKQAEFAENDCHKEISLFNDCNKHLNKGIQYMNVEKTLGQKEAQPGDKLIPSFQLNRLLKKFPS